MNGAEDENNDVWEREPEGKPGVQVNFNFSTNVHILRNKNTHFFPIKQVQDLHKIFKSKTRTSKPVHAVQVQCFF